MATMSNEAFSHPTYGPCLRLARGASEALVSLQGGQLLSWRCRGQEQLFLSARSRHSPGAAIRGGVPVIFPQFADRGPGPRHGFARTSVWTAADAPESAGAGSACVRLRLQEDASSLAVWPHRFVLEQTITLGDAELQMDLALHNTDSHAWEFAAALHSYWRVAPGQPLRLGALANAAFDDRSASGEPFVQAPTLALDHEVERLYHHPPPAFEIGDARVLAFRSSGWPQLMVWNPGAENAAQLSDLEPGGHRHFICVEPVHYRMATLQPGETWRAEHAVRLNENGETA
jgi:glucose-6-phosphate 1-epimerase